METNGLENSSRGTPGDFRVQESITEKSRGMERVKCHKHRRERWVFLDVHKHK